MNIMKYIHSFFYVFETTFRAVIVVSVLHYLSITVDQQVSNMLIMFSILGFSFVMKPLIDLFYEISKEKQ